MAPISTIPSDISVVTQNRTPGANAAGSPTVLRTSMPSTIAISIASIGWRAGVPIENGGTGSWCSSFASTPSETMKTRPGRMERRDPVTEALR